MYAEAVYDGSLREEVLPCARHGPLVVVPLVDETLVLPELGEWTRVFLQCSAKVLEGAVLVSLDHLYVSVMM